MRSSLRLLIAAAIAINGVLAPPSARAQDDDFLEGWFTATVGTGPTSYGGEKRGYLTGGSFSGRHRMSTDSLMTITPPSLNTSCGGIDLVVGGISFLDPEFLVQKLENILAAAPAMAFEMALGHMCPSCLDKLNQLEHISNVLNQAQLNDCQAARRLVAYADPSQSATVRDDLYRVVEQYANELGLTKNSAATAEEVEAVGNRIPPTMTVSQTLAACPAHLRTLFGGGSVVQNTADAAGIPEYGDLLRGLLGDVFIDWSQPTPAFPTMAPCQENVSRDVSEFIRSGIHMRDQAGICSRNNSLQLIGHVRDMMTSIGGKIATAAVLTTAEQQFLANTTELRVHQRLINAKRNDVLEAEIYGSQDLVATIFGISVIKSLHDTMETALAQAMVDSMAVGEDPAAAPADRCDMRLLQPGIRSLSRMRADLGRMQEMWIQEEIALMSTWGNRMQYIMAVYEQMEKDRQDLVTRTVE